MKFRKVVKLFLEHTEQNRKPATLRHYRGRLKSVRKRLGDQPIHKITLADVEDALNRANKRADGSLWSPDTRRSNSTVLQQVFKFAVRHRLLEEMPFDKLDRPRTRRRERIPTDEENAAIEALCPPEFLLIFRALRQTGARPGELCAVRIKDYDRDSRLLLILDHKTATRTGKPRKIGVGQKFGEIVAQAIGERTEGPIFLDSKGRAWTTPRLSAEFRKYRDKAGISKEICLYCQRHCHATALCAVAGIHVAAQALGHSSIQTTMRYLHPDDSQLARNQDLV